MAKRSDGTQLPRCKFKVPGTTSALLTFTTKMPGASWSIPAGEACPFAFYGKNAICGSDRGAKNACYAKKGDYMRYAAVRNAQFRRFDWAVECMRTDQGIEEFITLMVTAIKYYTSADNPYFRVHDSGDLFSIKYTQAWAEIARRLPDVKFWFPTRSYRGPWNTVIIELATLDNVTVRPSALRFGDVAPVIPGLHAGTTATIDGFSCPAAHQGNACLDCRACWDDKETDISYHKH